MVLTVFWSKFAEDRLEDIANYYKIKVSPTIAQKLINGLIDKSIELEKNPYIGQKNQFRKQDSRL